MQWSLDSLFFSFDIDISIHVLSHVFCRSAAVVVPIQRRYVCPATEPQCLWLRRSISAQAD